MPRPTENQIDESRSGSAGEWVGLGRRPLLKALGAGATVSLGSGAATGQSTPSDAVRAEERGADGDAMIDPHFGYATFDATAIPASLDPDHEVELTAAPPDPAAGRPPLLVFDPVGLQVDPGDVVQFTFISPDHTVTAAHPDIGHERRVPEESPPFSSPVMGPGAAWLYRFDHEGVYDLYCAPHLLLGMVMRLVVGDLASEEIPEYARSVAGLPNREELSAFLNQMHEDNEDCVWPFVTAADILGTDALAPMAIQESGTVPFGTVAEELGYQYPPTDGGEEPTATVQVQDHPELGEILVGPDGMTLYMFEQDTQGAGESTCYDGCSSLWPPLTVEDEPVAGDGVTAELGTFERETGETQVTANGWPLYYYSPDEAPGDATGQGFNGVWWVLGPDGTPVRNGSNG